MRWSWILLLFCLTTAAIVLLGPSSWEERGTKLSPDGLTRIVEYAYMDDRNRHAPYGTYLLLAPAEGVLPATFGHVAYAGYCDDISYEWLSNEVIELSLGECKSENIRTLASQAYGIELVLK